jgi:hypothetical protein
MGVSANQAALEKVLVEALECDVITSIARKKNIGIRKAMDTYYKSRLADQIDKGLFGIQYLDAEYLADDLIENEPNIFD